MNEHDEQLDQDRMPPASPERRDGSNDDLDRLLHRWHEDNASRAAARRDELLAGLRRAAPTRAVAGPTPASAIETIRRFAMHRYTRAAACVAVTIALITLLVPTRTSRAEGIIFVPDGGRLEARNVKGGLIGPCPLEHTDVDVEISGPFTRVTLNQRYTNAYDEPIEAVYVFPLSHTGAVDRMTMTVGDRVVVGEVKERSEARHIYEQARASGYVASLLEQERPNIFTQSVANIEPGATIDIEISFVELVTTEDGVSSFMFPMVVAPRYIPGSPTTTRSLIPAELDGRNGVVLRGPARIEIGDVPEEQRAEGAPTLGAGRLQNMLKTAQPIGYPGAPWWGEGANANLPGVWSPFQVTYANESKEIGWIYLDGTGQINGRWFFVDPRLTSEHGTGYEADTDQVPDASRITPMPVHPSTRAGHDISVTVRIDTGGPALEMIESELHAVTGIDRATGKPQATIVLASETEIPNRDFILRWKQDDEAVTDAHFAHNGDKDDKGGFFTLMLQPPGRPTAADARAREIVFVLDCSGSMEGFPIEQAKKTMLEALTKLRGKDTFNVVTFNNSNEALFAAPQPGTEANVTKAMAYVDSRQGGGGTEMRPAVIRALTGPRGTHGMPIAKLLDIPASGIEVDVICATAGLASREAGIAELNVNGQPIRIQSSGLPAATHVRLRGTWTLVDGFRTLVAASCEPATEPDVGPFRLVLFMSDGEVGNDDAVIDAVRQHADDARVFTIAIGDSPNRSLLDLMAEAGRGKADYVTLQGDPKATVERFVRRIQTPVLTDIAFELNGIEIHDTIPSLDSIPDLYDEEPIIVHGRYTKPGKGTLTVRGNTGGGAFERAIAVNLPEQADEHDVIQTLWARERVDELTKAGDARSIIQIGTEFQIMTKHTSFVAVERSRMIIGGQPRFVAVPIEMPHGQSWPGTFGGPEPQIVKSDVFYLGAALHEVRRERFEQLGQQIDSAPAQEQAGEAVFVDGQDVPFQVNSVDGVRGRETLGRTAVAGRESRFSWQEDWYDQNQVATEQQELYVLYSAAQAQTRAYKQHGRTLTAGDALYGEPQAARYRALTDVDLDACEFTGSTGRANGTIIDGSFAGRIELPDIEDQTKVMAGFEATSFGVEPATVELVTSTQSPDQTVFLGDIPVLGEAFDLQTGLHVMAGNEPLSQESVLPLQQAANGLSALEREQLVDGKMRQVRQLQSEMRYEEALKATEEILAVDEMNTAALALREMTQMNMYYRDYVEVQRQKELGITRDLIEIQKGTIPPSENWNGPGMRSVTGVMQYPADWPVIAHRAGKDAAEQSPADAVVAARLQDVSIPVDFANNTLEQVVAFMQQATGLSIYVDWRALDAIGIGPDAEVGLALGALPVGTALDRVLEQVGGDASRPKWTIDDGMIVISSAEAIDGMGFTRVSPHDAAVLTTMPAEHRAGLGMHVLMTYVQPQAWEANGGTMARVEVADDDVSITPLVQTAEAQAVVEDARILADALKDWYFAPNVQETPIVIGPLIDPLDEPTWIQLSSPIEIHVMLDPTFESALQAWAQASGIPATIDAAAFTALGADPAATIPHAATAPAAAGPALDALLQAATTTYGLDAGTLGFTVRDGGIVVSNRIALDRQIVLYDVRDLASIDPADPSTWNAIRLLALSELVTGLIEPPSWKAYGGDIGISTAVQGFLVIQHTADVHLAIEILLDQMRLARGIDPAGRAAAIARAWQADPAGRASAIVAYPIDDLLAIGRDAPARNTIARTVATSIRTNVDPYSWVSHGGEESWVIGYDRQLVIRTTPERHGAIRSFLVRVRDEFGDAAEREAERHAAEAKHADQLHLGRVLDKSLWPLVAATAEAAGIEPATTVPEAWAGESEGSIRVSLLLDPDRAPDLQSLGVDLLDRNDRGHAIGTVPLDRLADLARAEFVKRVEPWGS